MQLGKKMSSAHPTVVGPKQRPWTKRKGFTQAPEERLAKWSFAEPGGAAYTTAALPALGMRTTHLVQPCGIAALNTAPNCSPAHESPRRGRGLTNHLFPFVPRGGISALTRAGCFHEGLFMGGFFFQHHLTFSSSPSF